MLTKDNLKVSRIYEELTNDQNIQKAVERRSGRKKNLSALKRLLSPPKRDLMIPDDIFASLKTKERSSSFMTHHDMGNKL